jgi:hypothetical protein
MALAQTHKEIRQWHEQPRRGVARQRQGGKTVIQCVETEANPYLALETTDQGVKVKIER